jgi:hypothetical protein
MKKLGLSVRIGLAAAIATAGTGMVAFVPHTINGYERDRQDLLRARNPLLKQQLADSQNSTELEFVVSIPTDAQWQRIKKRLGSPGFLLVIATDPEANHTETFPATEFVSNVHVTEAGRELTLTPTVDVPERYSSTNAANAFAFDASGSSRLALHVRIKNSKADAYLMVFPRWNHLEVWDWGDGLSMGQGFFQLVAPLITIFGVALMLVAIVVAVAPLRPTR